MTRTGRMRIGPKDSQGVPLAENQEVAYNRSGDVIPGTIQRIASSDRIIIEYGATDAHLYVGDKRKTSIVKNPRSILVLKEADGSVPQRPVVGPPVHLRRAMAVDPGNPTTGLAI